MSAIELAVNTRNVVESGMDHAGSRRSIRCYEGFGLNLSCIWLRQAPRSHDGSLGN